MLVSRFVSEDHSLLLDQVLFLIFFLLLFQNALEQVFTRSFVHFQNALCYDFIHLFGRQVVQQIPVLVVSVLFFHGSLGILGNIGPFFLGTEFLENLGIFLRQLLNESNLGFIQALTSLELPDLSF